jgi:hypothetical protein
MIKDDNKRISVTITKAVHEKLKKDAEYEDRSVGNMAAKIINDYYKVKTDE